jgi:hypothetical protein
MAMRKPFLLTIGAISVPALAAPAAATNHYTAKQLEALAQRVGSEFWINAPSGNAPLFFTAPAAGAATFRPANNESFEISELTGITNKTPYYKVKFQSGKIAYLKPETFHEEINSTIVNSDPMAEEKRKAAEQAEAEKQRLEWINAQPWPPKLKEAAINKHPTPGLSSAEVRQVMGPPRRIVKLSGQAKVRGATTVHEERWFYPDGTVLWFRNEILSRVDRPNAK